MAELSPVDWAKRPIQKYADFTGRAPRAEYWWYVLATIVAYVVLMMVERLLGLDTMIGPYGLLTFALMLALLVPGIAVGIRRLHDTNRSGWWMLLMVPYLISTILAVAAMSSGSMAGLGAAGFLGLIGLVCAVVLLVFMVLPGTPGANDYGPDPYGADVEKVFA